MSDKLALSHSKISTLARCSLQFWFAYEAKIRLKPTGKMMQGDVVGDATDHNFKQKITTGEDIGIDVVQDFAAEAFDKRVAEGQAHFNDDERPDKLKDQAIEITGLHHQLVAPRVQPIGVQVSLNLEFPDRDYIVHQYGDVIEMGTVRDLKVAGRRTNPDSIKGSFQLNLYAIGYETQLGKPPDKVVFDQFIRGAKKEPYNQIIGTPSDVDRQGTLLKLDATAKQITSVNQEPLGLIYPADPAANNSPCAWCGFARMCVPANKPWWKYLQGPEGIELAKKEARRVLTEERLARRIEETVKERDAE